MYINKYRLWDRKQKITWFHILLARNNLSFFAVTMSPAHLANRRWSCLAVQSPGLKSLPGDILENAGCSYHRFTAWFDVPSTPTIPFSSFVVDVDGYCVTIT